MTGARCAACSVRAAGVEGARRLTQWLGGGRIDAQERERTDARQAAQSRGHGGAGEQRVDQTSRRAGGRRAEDSRFRARSG
ncbi:hypothetical protein BSIN_1873 [Burkholderia singularis]|uniref:Uncharacterized protein n=1 Tax=Burkholderia singularis TaxID=1503053 RepID=A0A238H048_9BURK|nr:hypothetical protein BSIN_1873 [Burkholderia singularis]